MKTPSILLALALAATSALAQQTPTSAKTTEQQARSYVLSAFMTGSAPMILSDDVAVTPALRDRLKLAPEAGSRAIYQELVRITGGRALSVRPSIREEIANAQAHSEPGKPLFTVEAGNDALVLQYDLDRDVVSFVGQPTAVPVAVTVPVKEPAAPEKVAESAPAPTAASAPAPAPASAPAPAQETAAPTTQEPKPVETHPLQVVEPQVPHAAPVAPPPTVQAQAAPTMKPNGPCVIKPVMSDQDLVNCGATPPK